MTAVERIARVIARGQGGRVLGEARAQWFSDNYWPNSVGDALAVLEALRDPTEEMQRAWQGPEPWDHAALDVWQGMIDAALKGAA